MNVRIHTNHFEADTRLLEHVQHHLDKLPAICDKITTVEVFLKMDNLSHQIKDKMAEIRVHLPPYDLFTSYQSKSFEMSFDEAFNSMVQSVKRRKEKAFH